MKYIYVIVLFCSYCLCANAQSSKPICIGEIETVFSKILNEERKIWIHLPKDTISGEVLKQKYPVIYVLDGDAHFSSIVGVMENLSAKSNNNVLPKCIIVGITNTNRRRDLTPTKLEMDVKNKTNNSGGGEKFISFLEKELIPKIDSKYPTAPYKMLIGHSLGGLLAMHSFYKHPYLFDSYISVDPAIAWANKKLLEEMKFNKLEPKHRNKKLFLGIANTLPKGLDIEDVEIEQTKSTLHIRSILELESFLNKESNNSLKFKGKYYENESHASSPLITTYDGLRFIFDYYDVKIDNQLFYDPKSEVVEGIVEHYKKVSKLMGYEVKPSGNFINKAGEYFLKYKQFKKSESLFKLNAINFPKSYEVYNSLAKLYEAIGENDKATLNLKKSNSLQNNLIK